VHEKDRTKFTFIQPTNYVGLLSEMIRALPSERRLKEANIYTSTDESLAVDVFEFDDPHGPTGRKFRPTAASSNRQRQSDILQLFQSQLEMDRDQGRGASGSAAIREHQLEERLQLFLQCCDEHYVINTASEEILKHFQMIDSCATEDRPIVRIEDGSAGGSGDAINGDEGLDGGDVFSMDLLQNNGNGGLSLLSSRRSQISLLTVVLKREWNDDAFQLIVAHLGRQMIDIVKATLVRVGRYLQGDYLLLALNVRSTADQSSSSSSLSSSSSSVPLHQSPDRRLELQLDLARLLYLDDRALQFTDRWSLESSELVAVLSTLVHCLLAEEQPLIYTLYHIDEFIGRYPSILNELIKAWRVK
jgi:hypothetical protein